jgi:hypothetical protein
VSIIPAVQEVEIGRLWSEARPRQKLETLSEKITNAKKKKVWVCGLSDLESRRP